MQLRKHGIITKIILEFYLFQNKDKDSIDYMPHDKESILKRKVIKVKLRDDMPKYNSKLKDKN